MNSFQYAIAKAAWEAYHEAKYEAPIIGGFDILSAVEKRAWAAAASAALYAASRYAS
jgi:hypothetical protein